MELVFLIAALTFFTGWGVVSAKTYLSQPQAIQLAFPASGTQRKTVFLSAEQAAAVEKLSGVKPDSRIVTYYVSRSSGAVQGVAFFDRRVVRTLPIVYMAVVKPTGTIDRVEILSFEEPDDYFPPAKWLGLYRNRILNNDLSLGRSIPHITGASLTSQTMNDGLRLILATYQVAVKNAL